MEKFKRWELIINNCNDASHLINIFYKSKNPLHCEIIRFEWNIRNFYLSKKFPNELLRWINSYIPYYTSSLVQKLRKKIIQLETNHSQLWFDLRLYQDPEILELLIGYKTENFSYNKKTNFFMLIYCARLSDSIRSRSLIVNCLINCPGICNNQRLQSLIEDWIEKPHKKNKVENTNKYEKIMEDYFFKLRFIQHKFGISYFLGIPIFGYMYPFTYPLLNNFIGAGYGGYPMAWVFIGNFSIQLFFRLLIGYSLRFLIIESIVDIFYFILFFRDVTVKSNYLFFKNNNTTIVNLIKRKFFVEIIFILIGVVLNLV